MLPHPQDGRFQRGQLFLSNALIPYQRLIVQLPPPGPVCVLAFYDSRESLLKEVNEALGGTGAQPQKLLDVVQVDAVFSGGGCFSQPQNVE